MCQSCRAAPPPSCVSCEKRARFRRSKIVGNDWLPRLRASMTDDVKCRLSPLPATRIIGASHSCGGGSLFEGSTLFQSSCHHEDHKKQKSKTGVNRRRPTTSKEELPFLLFKKAKYSNAVESGGAPCAVVIIL